MNETLLSVSAPDPAGTAGTCLTCDGCIAVGVWESVTQVDEVSILLQHKHQRGITKHRAGKTQTLQYPRGQCQPVEHLSANPLTLHGFALPRLGPR